MVPAFAWRARAVSAAPAGDHDEVASAEQAGVSLRVDRQPGGDEVVDPGLDAAGRAVVVQREAQHDRVGLLHLADQQLGQRPGLGLGRCVLVGRQHCGQPAGRIKVRQGIAAEVPVGDGAAGMRGAPDGGGPGAELAADRGASPDA